MFKIFWNKIFQSFLSSGRAHYVWCPTICPPLSDSTMKNLFWVLFLLSLFFSLDVIKFSPMGYHLGDIQDNEMTNFYEFLILSTNRYFTQHLACFIIIFKVHLGSFVLFSTSQLRKLILKGIRIIQTPPNSSVEELRLAIGPLNIGIILKFCFQKDHKNTQPYFIDVAHRLNVKGTLYIGAIRSMAFFTVCIAIKI